MDFLTMSISSSGSWTSVERIMSGTRHPIRFVIEANFLQFFAVYNSLQFQNLFTILYSFAILSQSFTLYCIVLSYYSQVYSGKIYISRVNGVTV